MHREIKFSSHFSLVLSSNLLVINRVSTLYLRTGFLIYAILENIMKSVTYTKDIDKASNQKVE
ncbi:hypothetical protein EJP81_25040 (plasmid) [Rahnella aquatilis]|jgi:hypothetical protein|nr:hypothetical protein D3Z09_23735 [Rahnella aquatilis]MQB52885.1 hypothetical protein [Rahnella sp. RcJ3]QBJ07361.1 hypothetical protein EYS10_02105 [Rahnella aquatilis]QEU49870.1 hypothetical protein EJP80_25415 [Rahnella aquatilis]QEU50892.1 hypothetical protein EJP79_25040 [Rahnella aquatilis]